ncbi:MAG: MarR family transcriptional regulator [Ignavibacteriae bacterium]|nr:MarR family transcriptional regulator [Ignavibacteriota bacterium]
MVKLEEEIKQKSFSNPYHKLIVNILYTGSWMNLLNAKHLKNFGITLPQYNVLRILRGQHNVPASVNLISERMLDKASNVSRILDKLIVKEHVVKKTRSDDRRGVDVKITKKGLKLLAEIDRHKEELEGSFKTLSKAEAGHLNELLDKLRG